MRIKYMDPEWDEAAEANERPEYYFCKMVNGGECVKCYKPSLATIVLSRGMYKEMTPIPTFVPERKRPNRIRRRLVGKGYYQPYDLFTRSIEGIRR